MFGSKFNEVLKEDSDSDVELESTSKLIRVSTAYSFKDGLHDRYLRSEQEKHESINVGEGLSSTSSEENAAGYNKELLMITAAGEEHEQETTKTTTGCRKQKSRKRKAIQNGEKDENSESPTAMSSKTTKKEHVTLPKTYAAASVQDRTRIPETLQMVIPSIEWKDAISANSRAGVGSANMLTSNLFEARGVMGHGKGVGKGLPMYEYDSLWQYLIPSEDAENSKPWEMDPATPPPDVKLKFLSVVSCVSLGMPLNLEKIAEKGFDLHYAQDSFTPIVMRLKNPVATVMLFKSGKMVVTGTKSEKNNRVAIFKITRRLQRMGIPVRPFWCQIQNITATCNIGFRIRVHLLAQIRGVDTQYHPELFTGVTISFAIPRAKAILFRTGSILITGVKSEKEAEDILHKIYPLAKLYAN